MNRTRRERGSAYARPYTWTEDDTTTPGAIIRRQRLFLFIPDDELLHLANELADIIQEKSA